MQKGQRGDGRPRRGETGGREEGRREGREESRRWAKGSVFVPFRAGNASAEADGCVCESATRGRARKRKSSDRLRHDTEPLRD